jgi:hypothetical protein
VSLVGFTLLAFSQQVGADDEEIPIALAQVPVVIRNVAIKAAPGLRAMRATRTVEGARTYFNIHGIDALGHDMNVEVTARGQVLSVSTVIGLSEVPGEIYRALRKKTPGVLWLGAEAMSKSGKVVAYRLGGRDPHQLDVEVTVSADGRSVEIEVDD